MNTRADARTPARLRAVLALTDLSARAEPALARAALLAAEHGASLRFMYLPLRHPTGATQGVPPRLAQRCRVLGRRHGIGIEPVAAQGPWAQRLLREAGQADLVLLTSGIGVHRRALWARTVLDLLLHATQTPVLLVQRAARVPYRQALVAVDLNHEAPRLLQQAQRLGERARLTVCHSLQQHVQVAANSAAGALAAIEAQRSEARRRALVHLGGLLRHDENGLAVHDIAIGHGRPGADIAAREAELGSELIVVGRRRQPWLLDRLERSLSHQLLARVRGDLLHVPLTREDA